MFSLFRNPINSLTRLSFSSESSYPSTSSLIIFKRTSPSVVSLLISGAFPSSNLKLLTPWILSLIKEYAWILKKAVAMSNRVLGTSLRTSLRKVDSFTSLLSMIFFGIISYLSETVKEQARATHFQIDQNEGQRQMLFLSLNAP